MFYHAQFICYPTERHPSYHAANLAMLPNGKLAMVCFCGSRESAKDTVNMLFTLETDGTWSDGRAVVDEPEHASGNAVLMPVPDGRVILFYTLSYSQTMANWADSLVHYRFSEDSGETWGEAHTLTEEYGYIVRQPGVILSSGEWLLPIYDNRGGGKPEYEGMGGNEGSVFISGDGGQHWQRYGRMVAGAGTAQPNVIELEPGHLLAFLRTRNFWNGENPDWAYLYRAESWDYGRNWTHPVPTALPNNNSSMQMIRLQSGALVLAYNHQQQRLRSPLNVALSDDQGETWCFRRELEPLDPDGAEFSYPAILQTPDGLIHIAYTYKRTHMKHVVVDEEWIRQGRV